MEQRIVVDQEGREVQKVQKERTDQEDQDTHNKLGVITATTRAAEVLVEAKIFKHLCLFQHH